MRFTYILGIFPEKEATTEASELVTLLVELRKELRKRKEYELSDRI